MGNWLRADLGEHLTWGAFLFIVVAAFVGSIVQGVIGFGVNLVLVPAMALVVPEALPVAPIAGALPLIIGMLLRERDGADWSGLGWIALGRVPGSVIGAWIVATVAVGTLAVLAGGAVLAAVVASMVAATVPLTWWSKLTAGFASGVMGTATSIGGPAIALLYQHEEGPRLRATLAASFLVSVVVSLAVLAISGAVAGWQLVLAAGTFPGLLGGLAVSTRVKGRVDGRWLRPSVLVFATVTALMAIARGF
jgi:uncharacterized protein